MQYRFTCRYHSEFGSWAEGDVAEFDDRTAAWLLRDVAGCIVAVEPEPERAIKHAPKDRQLKHAPKDRQLHPDDGVMTPENSYGVKRDND